ncbi:MAG: family 43 glycosylhydrolase [Bacteroidales bacterium]|nr:family 43 glycosylhydrolase [Bacteroidales bacterium]
MESKIYAGAKNIAISVILAFAIGNAALPQAEEDTAVRMDAVYVPDNGNGTYKNPVIYADYSDPDAIRVNDDFYMVSSSFNCAPGIPVLHSKDLVNWTIINHVFMRQPPDSVYNKPGHGLGVWAPSIRYRNGHFYVYYADPDFGIYMAKTDDPAGTWEHKLVQKAYGWIDPCPFWDDNDSAYLVHAWANSRVGFKSILTLRRMSSDGESVSTDPADSIMVFDGNDIAHPLETIEGPKMYKRNGYYYVFAPYGGVANGYQAVLRSDTLPGPYDYKTVLEKGSTTINGPHQGAWIELESGESWFIHFQEKLPHGRIVHLQPVVWTEDWPVMGIDNDGDEIGEPVASYTKPDVGQTWPIVNPQTSDKFNTDTLGLQWQWHSNFDSAWFSLDANPGNMRLYAVSLPEDFVNLWDIGSMLLQKLPAEKFSATTKIKLHLNDGENAGLVVMGQRYTSINVMQTDTGLVISQKQCSDARAGLAESTVVNSAISIDDSVLYLRVAVTGGGTCNFGYSLDNYHFLPVGKAALTDEGRWIGAKVGLYCHRPYENTGDPGYADFDWFSIDDYYNRLPLPAFDPYPADGDSISGSSGLVISWGADKVFTSMFDVYIDTLPDPVSLLVEQAGLSKELTDLESEKTYYWRVDSKNDLGTVTGPTWQFTTKELISGIPVIVSPDFKLEPPIPNPFENFSHITFSIAKPSLVKINVYDAGGTVVKEITNKEYAAGTHNLDFHRENLNSGLYILKMKTGEGSLSRKLLIE